MTDEQEVNVIVSLIVFLLIYLPTVTLLAERAWKGRWERNRSVEAGNIFNFFWIITGGVVVYVLWLIVGFVWSVTSHQEVENQCFEISKYAILPFNRQLYDTRNWLYLAQYSENLECIWGLGFGFPLFLCHCFFAGVLALTIIGLPLACAHLRLANCSLRPFGYDVLSPVSILREGTQFLLYVNEAFFYRESALVEIPAGESVYSPNVNICCEYREGEVILLE